MFLVLASSIYLSLTWQKPYNSNGFTSHSSPHSGPLIYLGLSRVGEEQRLLARGGGDRLAGGGRLVTAVTGCPHWLRLSGGKGMGVQPVPWRMEVCRRVRGEMWVLDADAWQWVGKSPDVIDVLMWMIEVTQVWKWVDRKSWCNVRWWCSSENVLGHGILKVCDKKFLM